MIYKYREFGEYTDKIILNSELFFATYNSFNDPFDCNLDVNSYNNDEFDSYIDDFCESYPQTKSTLLKGQSKKEFREVIKSKLEEFKSHTGILSMSRKNKNILMWSHYSDHHKGLCFGFEKMIFEGAKGQKVDYAKKNKYDLISYLDDSGEELKRVFMSKSKYWKYEKEFRFIELGHTGVKKYNKNKLKQIIFGCKADDTNIKKIIQLCQINGFEHVKFKKAKLIPGKFALDFDDIDKDLYLNQGLEGLGSLN